MIFGFGGVGDIFLMPTKGISSMGEYPAAVAIARRGVCVDVSFESLLFRNAGLGDPASIETHRRYL